MLKLFDVIKTELETHAHLEETIFYPAVQEDGDKELVELTSEAIKEHLDIKAMLGELAVTDEDSFDALLVKLIEDVRHHVSEEEGEMFPAVESQFSADGLEKLGTQMQAEKERFKASAESIHN